MANQFRSWVATVILTLLISVVLFQIAILRGRSWSIITIAASKGITGQEMVTVKHHRERTNQAGVTYSNHDHTLPKIDHDSYQRRIVRLVGETQSENGRKGLSETQIPGEEPDAGTVKRQIPGGPDGRHHSGILSKRKIPAGGSDAQRHASKGM